MSSHIHIYLISTENLSAVFASEGISVEKKEEHNYLKAEVLVSP